MDEATRESVVDTGEFLAITVPEEVMAIRDVDCRVNREHLIDGIKTIARTVHNAHHLLNRTQEVHWWHCPWSSCRHARQLIESTHARQLIESTGEPFD